MRRDSTVYVANLPNDCRESEIKDLFSKYGRINLVEIKGNPDRGPQFAFVEFEDSRDAKDAINGRDGCRFGGNRLCVEMGKGEKTKVVQHRSPRRKYRDPNGYKVEASNLPKDASWQDLKDHLRGIGRMIFADVDKRGNGYVVFETRDDAKECVRKMDDTKLVSRSGEKSYIRLKEFGNHSRSRSPQRSSTKQKHCSSSRSQSPQKKYLSNHSRSISQSKDSHKRYSSTKDSNARSSSHSKHPRITAPESSSSCNKICG